MHFEIIVTSCILLFFARNCVTSPISESNPIFENLRNEDGVIEAIPASLLPKLHPSKDIEASRYTSNDGKNERSEDSLSPIFRFLITTVTSTVSTTVSTATVMLSTWSTCYTTDANIPSCVPTVGQVTTSTGKKKREASHLVETHPKNTLVVTLDGNPIDFNEIIAPSRASRQNNLSEEADDHKENVKDGRARIGPPPRYEEVGISGLPILGKCSGGEDDVDVRQEYQQPRFITIHSTSTSSVTATSTQTVLQAAKQTLLFKSDGGGCFPQQLLATTLSISKC